VVETHRRLAVVQVEDVWRIAEGWWRDDPIARTYMHLAIEDGRRLTLFHDDTRELAAGWYEQRY
jgi:hypothetical protein